MAAQSFGAASPPFTDMEDYIEWLKIYCVNGSVLGVVSFADVEAVLKIIALALTIVWTAVKIVKLIKDD
jgi:hypothetical protein